MKPRSICMLTLQLSLLSLTAQESPAPGVSASQQQPSHPSGGSPQPAPPRDGAHDFDFLIGNWKAHFAGFPIVWLVRPLGLSMTVSRITRSSSIAMRILRSSRSTIPRSTCTSKRRHSGYIIRTRISGVSTLWTWTKAFSAYRQLLVNLLGIAASSTIRNNIRAARF